VRRVGTTIALAAAVAAIVLLAQAAGASAATSTIAFTPCAGAPAFGCAHLVVPLDPTGAIPGTVTLRIRRKLAASGAATEAVIALAGGPGQAAVPFAGDAAMIVQRALGTRDFVIFDQRGTGTSGALKCTALSDASAPLTIAIPNCAKEVGATRGLYTTDDSAFDIEQIRKALGYTKVVLYGTSYGTKVALRYAAEYPGNVSGLLLDSTVVPNGPGIFDESSFQAVPRILDQLCAAGACAGIPDPVGDLKSVLARLGGHARQASFFTGAGARRAVVIDGRLIAQVMLAGDEDPVLRSDLPAALHAAAAGRYGLLAILIDHALVGGAVSNKGIDNPLFFDTECEELPFPWNRADAPAARRSEALAAARAMPAGTFGPFSPRTAFDESSAPVCAYWPFATAAPETTITSIPNVPTLIISGADDLRTPTANALAVKAMIPDATIVVVPGTGHSALTTEFGHCGVDAVDAFFAGAPIATSCAAQKGPAYLRPAGATPSSFARIHPVAGLHGSSGRTAHAVELTLKWTARELAESLFETLIGSYNPSYNHGLGGLHGGFAKVATKTSQAVKVSFHAFSYVSGVTISGTLTGGVGRLEIAGAKAAAGTLIATAPNDFRGTLGGVHVHFTFARASTAVLTASASR
jgi:pimeloyl-ACP methyl ester carboxylesterase